MNGCKHQKCEMQCWQVCSIAPCVFSCDKKLECGHICLSPCGEICPGDPSLAVILRMQIVLNVLLFIVFIK